MLFVNHYSSIFLPSSRHRHLNSLTLMYLPHWLVGGDLTTCFDKDGFPQFLSLTSYLHFLLRRSFSHVVHIFKSLLYLVSHTLLFFYRHRVTPFYYSKTSLQSLFQCITKYRHYPYIYIYFNI